MTRFWNSYRTVKREREKRAGAHPVQSTTRAIAEKRRSPRLALRVPVLVYGHTPRKEPFHEAAHTVCINADGGLLELMETVYDGQVILLVNTKTQEERRCRVVRVGEECDGKRAVSFELMPPRGRFWELVYDAKERVWQSSRRGHERQ